ncbi:hypothetical protein [Deinococcus sp. S9]|uniref:hypothetical protein n=1 Tax=Deinococcus sp. S9 TaxID=2545754 RepID=UPI0010553161|nr:hypothetical protein [Deinococcus sp. S9]TDE85309.1 hypothetical protein E0686_12295 [Deinococcus sp. S9]
MPESPPALLTHTLILARSPAAFRMLLRGWPLARLRDYKRQALQPLPADYRTAYLEELRYRVAHPESRGGREA